MLPSDIRVGRNHKCDSKVRIILVHSIHITRPVPLQEVAGSLDSTSAPARYHRTWTRVSWALSRGGKGSAQTHSHWRRLFPLGHRHRWKAKCFISIHKDVVFKNRGIVILDQKGKYWGGKNPMIKLTVYSTGGSNCHAVQLDGFVWMLKLPHRL